MMLSQPKLPGIWDSIDHKVRNPYSGGYPDPKLLSLSGTGNPRTKNGK